MTFDVAVVGAGYAGLSFTAHLLRERPGARVLVVDPRPLPGSPTRRGLGESSSELAAWYLREVLGLGSHLEGEQVVKFGLRFWLRGAPETSALASRIEYGPMGRPPGVDGPPPLEPHAYQLHRGRLEAELARSVTAAGAELRGRTRLVGVETEGEGEARSHRLKLAGAGGESSCARARWLVDASGGPELGRSLWAHELRERTLAHHLAAAWWWVEGRVDPASWADPSIQARVDPRLRWRSTHHFVDRGAWTWLIPLADGSTSVGVVVDLDLRPELAELGDEELGPALRGLLDQREPELARALARLDSTPPRGRRTPSRIFTAPLQRRVVVTGAALGFLDPLYSSGHDLSALVHELAMPEVLRDLEGPNPSPSPDPDADARLRQLDLGFARIVDHFETLYLGGFSVLADGRLAVIKLSWDQLVYFGWLCPLAMTRRLGDLEFASRTRPFADRVHRLNERIQALLREWASKRGARGGASRNPAPPREGPGFIDQGRITSVMDRFLALAAYERAGRDAELSAMVAGLAHCLELLEDLALAIFERACLDLGVPPPEEALDPYALTLEPARWAADRMFAPRRARRCSPRARRDLDYLWTGEWAAPCP